MKFLYFLSKTDEGVVPHCTANTRNIQATLGFFVLLTGMLAFVSGTYAISNMFVHENMETHQPEMASYGWPCSLLLGLVYCIFIMAIDREIVSASNKIAVLLRLPLALMISLIVSTPMEMQLFNSKIIKKLSEQDEAQNKPLKDSLDQAIWDSRNKIRATEKQRHEAMQKREYWLDIKQRELIGNAGPLQTGRAGQGPAYKEADENAKIQEGLVNTYNQDLVPLRDALSEAIKNKKVSYSGEKIKQSYDILSKSIALGEVKKEDKTGSANRISMGVFLLFLMFETIPCFIKLFLPKTEYDALIDKRRLLNILSADMIYEDARSEYFTKSPEDLQRDNPIRIRQMLLSQSE